MKLLIFLWDFILIKIQDTVLMKFCRILLYQVLMRICVPQGDGGVDAGSRPSFYILGIIHRV